MPRVKNWRRTRQKLAGETGLIPCVLETGKKAVSPPTFRLTQPVSKRAARHRVANKPVSKSTKSRCRKCRMMQTFKKISFAALAAGLLVFFTPAVLRAAESSEQDKVSDGKDLLTIAVVINDVKPDGSAWDIGAGADIVLCGAKGCYVSNGLSKAATFYEGSRGPWVLNKAGACRDAVKCVFRGVNLDKLRSGDDRGIQPMDVDYVSHNYLEKVTVGKIPVCKAGAGAIACESGFHMRSYSMWVMPEVVAQKGGKAGLDHVLFKGILSQRVAALTAEIGDLRGEVQTDVARFYKLMFDIDVPASCVSDPTFLTEAFYVTGLADASQRRAEFVLKDLLGNVPVARLEGLVRQTPAIFWAYRDIARQLKRYGAAKTALYEEEADGIFLKKEAVEGAGEAGPNEETLVYGWKARGRARSGLSACGVEVTLDSERSGLVKTDGGVDAGEKSGAEN